MSKTECEFSTEENRDERTETREQRRENKDTIQRIDMCAIDESWGDEEEERRRRGERYRWASSQNSNR